jgi:hypothetical protein
MNSIKVGKDNQLGCLHSSLKREYSSDVGFKLEICYLDYPNIFTVYNVIDKNFAKEVRQFINDIPFDNTLQKLVYELTIM